MANAKAGKKTEPAPELSVVVPVHNEGDNIRPLIAEISDALKGKISFEMVYVDDGSSDVTPTILKEAAADHAELRVLRHVNCCGQSAAVMTGVKNARGRFIATLDGDGQNDPADIPALLDVLKAAPAPDKLLVAGWRAKRKDTEIKKVSSKLANGIRSYLLKDNTPDTGCGLKVFTRDAFMDMPKFDHMHRYLPALMMRRGGEVTSVQVNHRPRERGVSKYGTLDRLWVGIFDLIGVIWLVQRGKVPVVEAVIDRDT